MPSTGWTVMQHTELTYTQHQAQAAMDRARLGDVQAGGIYRRARGRDYRLVNAVGR